MVSEQQADTPFEATKGGQTYWWTIAVELPSYPVIEWARALTLVEAEQYWLLQGYALPDPPEVI